MKPPASPSAPRRLPLQALLIFALPFALLLLAETLRRTGVLQPSEPRAIALLTTPRPLDFLGTPPPDVWHLIVRIDKDCDEPCQMQLRLLHGFRIALGRHSGNLRLAGLQHELPQEQIDHLQQQFPGLEFYPQTAAILPATSPAASPNNGRAVGIADPKAHLVATFAPDAEPEAVLKDIRKLMR